jgi:hypothetical protein
MQNVRLPNNNNNNNIHPIMLFYKNSKNMRMNFTLAVGIASYFISVTRENSVFRRVFGITKKSDYYLRRVCLPAQNSAPTGRIFLKFDV